MPPKFLPVFAQHKWGGGPLGEAEWWRGHHAAFFGAR